MKRKLIAIAIILITAHIAHAQTSSATIVVKGITETKGNILIAIGDKNKPLEMNSKMAPAKKKEVVFYYENLEKGKTNIYVFQDLNKNFILDFTHDKIPAEPCGSVENVEITGHKNKFEIKLIDHTKNENSNQ